MPSNITVTTDSPIVLIVDDLNENLTILSNILTSANFEVSFAKSGSQALENLKHITPDIILSDISMPDMDGFQFCEIVKSLDHLKEIPFIFITARGDSDSIIKGFDLGAIDYVPKPFNGAELIKRVNIHLELQRSKKELEMKNKQLTELNATKDKFFSILAHDLRNPFNSLWGFSDMILQNYDELGREKHLKYLEIIQITAKQGYALLDNLLYWARSQTGKLTHSPQLIDLQYIVNNNIDLIAGSASQKSISLNSTLTENCFVFADLNMISTVIRNLLSNAIKFTNINGRIDVIVENNANSNLVMVSIKDNGVGMNEIALNKIFRIENYYTTPGTENERGTGLGLILCKEFVERNGGKIWVESKENEGSCFQFTLLKDSPDTK